MNKRMSALCLLALGFTAAFPTNAYELRTHGQLTEKAFERSSLDNDPRLLHLFL
jgi:hypothetical protein